MRSPLGDVEKSLTDEIAVREAELETLREALAKILKVAGGGKLPLPDENSPTARNRRTRRTKAEMTLLKEEIRTRVRFERRLSVEIYRELLDAGVITDIRRDRDQVMKSLREMAESDPLVCRSGDFYWEESPSGNSFDGYDEEPF